MLKIAICDDISQELEFVYNYLDEYLIANTIEADIKKFSHPDELMSALEKENFNIYILDIVMPMINGLDLGCKIRKQDYESQIIYTTTEPQFALQAYCANPINYLIKPIQKQQFFDTLTLAISKLSIIEDQTFSVRTLDSLRVLKLSEINCCEYRNHTVIFSLKNGEEIISRTIRSSFSEYCEIILNNKHFLQCHTSFIVNMRRIEHFTKYSFTLLGGKTVSISTKQYPKIRDTYMDYLMSKER